jgi:hypothetical protein
MCVRRRQQQLVAGRSQNKIVAARPQHKLVAHCPPIAHRPAPRHPPRRLLPNQIPIHRDMSGRTQILHGILNLPDDL